MNFPERATQLAQESFGNNILFSFVGGSYATKKAKPTSDIDLFVLLARGDQDSELKFARRFLDFHRRYNLHVKHCGEVFSLFTLDTLLEATKLIYKTAPLILELACYHGDCILSIFRKGDIAMKFLADPKILITGDHNLLLQYEHIANEYFAKSTMARIQTEINNIHDSSVSEECLNVHHLRKFYENLVDVGNFIETPVGIGLERWFSKQVVMEKLASVQSLQLPLPVEHPRNVCPRNLLPLEIFETSSIKYQCLGTYHEDFEHD